MYLYAMSYTQYLLSLDLLLYVRCDAFLPFLQHFTMGNITDLIIMISGIATLLKQTYKALFGRCTCHAQTLVIICWGQSYCTP